VDCARYPPPYLMQDFWPSEPGRGLLVPSSSIYHRAIHALFSPIAIYSIEAGRRGGACSGGRRDGTKPEIDERVGRWRRREADNLILGRNCNLQRYSTGPVLRGQNGRASDEIEQVRRCRGWHVSSLLGQRMGSHLSAPDTARVCTLARALGDTGSRRGILQSLRRQKDGRFKPRSTSSITSGGLGAVLAAGHGPITDRLCGVKRARSKLVKIHGRLMRTATAQSRGRPPVIPRALHKKGVYCMGSAGQGKMDHALHRRNSRGGHSRLPRPFQFAALRMKRPRSLAFFQAGAGRPAGVRLHKARRDALRRVDARRDTQLRDRGTQAGSAQRMRNSLSLRTARGDELRRGLRANVWELLSKDPSLGPARSRSSPMKRARSAHANLFTAGPERGHLPQRGTSVLTRGHRLSLELSRGQRNGWPRFWKRE